MPANARHRAAILVLSVCGAIAISAGPEPRETPGTRRMAALLKELAGRLNPSANPILNVARAERFRAQMEYATDEATRFGLKMALGTELLLAGRTAEAIDHLTAAREQAAALGADDGLKTRLHETIALAYLRMAEQDNCIARHNADSCLLPIRGQGVYTRDRATRLAIKEYLELLHRNPDDLGYRWLLNVAYMTLGEYPARVPKQYRLEPKIFDSEYAIEPFTDVAPRLGLAVTGRAGGVIMDDFDRDGNLDLLMSSWGLTEQLRFFRNNGDGTFRERTAEAGLTGETGGLNLVQADYDNDGHLDVLVLRGAWLGLVGQGDHPSSLLRNRGDGTFDDVTEEAGLLGFRPTQTAAWADYDGDGWLDLFIGVEGAGRRSLRSELYRNNGDGTFSEVSAATALDITGFVKGATWGDYNNDGRPDLYVSRFGQPNLLFRNDGAADPAARSADGRPGAPAWRFTDVTEAAGVADPLNSFATWFWDFDNDGWQDLFVAPFLGFTGRNLATVVTGYFGGETAGETPRLYRNRRDGTFEDVTESAGLARPLIVMGSNYGDIDTDGFPDIYLGTGEPELSTLVPNRMFRNDGGRRFQDVTTSGRFGHLQKGHGIAFGDIDNDGDQDIYAVMGGAYEGDVYQNVLFLNPGQQHHWITLRLQGSKANRAAIGARIKLTVRTAAGSRELHATVTSGGSFGASPLQQTVGLGTALGIQSLEVSWPGTGQVQRFERVAMDRAYSIREDAETLEPLSVTRVNLLTSALR